MSFILRSGFGLGAALLLAAIVLAADPPKPATPPAKTPPPKSPEAKPTPPKAAPPPAEPAKPKTVDSMKVPAGGILVLVKEIKDALVPTGVWLTSDRYNELVNEIETLKRQLKPGKPKTPSSCKLLNGTVE